MVEPGMPKTYHQQVGKRIAHFREAAGMSKDQLGDKLLLSKDSISNMERGVTALRLDRAHVIALILGVTVNDLISEIRTGTDNLNAPILA